MRNAIVGVVLDLSLRHTHNDTSDVRLVDVAKKDLINFVRFLESDDEFYFYKPDSLKIETNKKGKYVYDISEYEPIPIEIENALKQTLYLVSMEDPDAFRCVVYITDMKSDFIKNKIIRVIQTNQINYLDCVIVLVGLGENADSFEDIEEAIKIRVSDAQMGGLFNSLKAVIYNGKIGSMAPSGE